MSVSDFLRRRPLAAQVFVKRGMNCPGCPFSPFETVADVAEIYRQDPIELAAALLQAAVSGDAAPKEQLT